MDIFDTIATRRSTRMFTDEQISDKDLETILAAGRTAPIGHSAYKSFQINVIQNKEVLDKMDAYCAAAWGNPKYHMFYNAPTLIIISATQPEESRDVRFVDAGCILENMHLAATALGLGSIILWSMLQRIPPCEEFIEKLELPEGFTPLVAFAVGQGKNKLPERKLSELPINKIQTKFLK